jgi:hypothetical protein
MSPEHHGDGDSEMIKDLVMPINLTLTLVPNGAQSIQ